MTDKKIPTVTIDSIALGDTRFIFTYPLDFSTVAQSIRRVGLIQPIILTPSANKNKYTILCGYKRVLACAKLGSKTIEAKIINDVSEDEDLFLIGLNETLSQRKLNYLEEGTILRKLTDQFAIPKKEVIKNHMSLLGLESSGFILDRLVSVANLEESIKKYLFHEQIPIHIAELFLHFLPEERAELVQMLEKLSFGVNKVREILTCIREISLRDSLPAGDLLLELGVYDILQNDELSPALKGNKIRNKVKQKKFPVINSLENECDALIKSLKLPNSISVKPPKFFEGNSLRIEFSVNNSEQLLSYAEILKKTAQGVQVNSLLKLLK